MAKQQFNPTDAKQLVEEIEKIYKRIGLTNPFSNGIHTVAELKTGLEEARDILLEWDEGVGDIERGFRSILNEVKTTGNSFNTVKRSLTSITSISAQIRDHQLGINQLTAKQLTQYKSKLDSEAASLANNVKALQDEKDELDVKTQLGTTERARLAQLNVLIANTNGLLQDQDSIQKLLNEKLDQEIHQRETIEKKLGVAGGLLRGIGKIPVLGNLVDTNEALNTAESTIETTGSSVKGLGAALGNLGKQAISGLLNPANLVLGAFTMIIEALKDVDKGAGEYAKSMNLTYGEALNLRGELAVVSSMSGDVALNSERLQNTLMAVGNTMGSNAKLNIADLKTFTKLREQAGYTNEELMGIQKLSLVNNKTLEANTKEILGAARAYNGKNKLALNEKQILKDVNASSASLKLSLGGSASQLAIAAAKSREFGLSLQQTEKIAESLLNFESSIESELSAELLTGRDLNLEQARLLALNGKTAEAAAEIARQVGTSADFSRMNVIQQEALAKAAGMTRDELAQSLIDRESLAKLGVADAKTAQEAYNILKSRGMSEAEIQKKLGDEELARQYEQQSLQDQFNDTVLKLKDIFVQLAEPMLKIITPFANLVTEVLPLINIVLQPVIATLRVIGSLITGIIKLITLDFKGAMEAFSPSNLFKGFEDLKAANNPSLPGGNNLAPPTPTIGNDVISPGSGTGYGSRTLLTGKDAIQLNNQDTVIAGTNLFGGTQQSTNKQDNSTLIAEIRALRNELNSRPVIVHSTVQLPNGEVLARSTNSENRKIHYGVQ